MCIRDRYELTAEKVDQPLDGAGAAIALAVGAEGTDIGAGAAVWHGVQTFCSNFNSVSYTHLDVYKRQTQSEEKIADLKHVTENHRGGYSRRRG